MLHPVIGLLESLERRSRPTLVVAGLVMLGLIGLVDYLAGYEMIFSVFYLLEVGLAAWFLGKGFGLLMSILSVVVWIGGDLAAGARYSSPWIGVWNALILVVFYSIVVWLLTSLRTLHRELEVRVQQRTQDLRREMEERERLEEEILKVGEREQQRLGRDLHDGLCQHLTATALAGQVLGEKLAAQSLPEAHDARQVVSMVEEGITQARNLARGLYLVEMGAEGLMAALQELAASITRTSRIACLFEPGEPVLIPDPTTATHLYRIAQEAISNAIRHGKPKHILVSLAERNGCVSLTVEDDGVGLAENWQEMKGLGIRTMAHRAQLIGASVSVEPALTGGTTMSCSLPRSDRPKERRYTLPVDASAT